VADWDTLRAFCLCAAEVSCKNSQNRRVKIERQIVLKCVTSRKARRPTCQRVLLTTERLQGVYLSFPLTSLPVFILKA